MIPWIRLLFQNDFVALKLSVMHCDEILKDRAYEYCKYINVAQRSWQRIKSNKEILVLLEMLPYKNVQKIVLFKRERSKVHHNPIMQYINITWLRKKSGKHKCALNLIFNRNKRPETTKWYILKRCCGNVKRTRDSICRWSHQSHHTSPIYLIWNIPRCLKHVERH